MLVAVPLALPLALAPALALSPRCLSMQTTDIKTLTITRRQLRIEATALLRQYGLSADGRPLLEARTTRHTEAISNRNLKWKPPKRR
jgi:hypothetical protein